MIHDDTKSKESKNQEIADLSDQLHAIENEIKNRENQKNDDDFAKKIEESIKNDIDYDDSPKHIIKTALKDVRNEPKINEMPSKETPKEIKAPPADDHETFDHHEDDKVDWWDYDPEAYMAAGALKPGEDPFDANKFNQKASDALKMDRDVPDTRHAQCKKVRITLYFSFIILRPENGYCKV